MKKLWTNYNAWVDALPGWVKYSAVGVLMLVIALWTYFRLPHLL